MAGVQRTARGRPFVPSSPQPTRYRARYHLPRSERVRESRNTGCWPSGAATNASALRRLKRFATVSDVLIRGAPSPPRGLHQLLDNPRSTRAYPGSWAPLGMPARASGGPASSPVPRSPADSSCMPSWRNVVARPAPAHSASRTAMLCGSWYPRPTASRPRASPGPAPHPAPRVARPIAHRSGSPVRAQQTDLDAQVEPVGGVGQDRISAPNGSTPNRDDRIRKWMLRGERGERQPRQPPRVAVELDRGARTQPGADRSGELVRSCGGQSPRPRRDRKVRADQCIHHGLLVPGRLDVLMKARIPERYGRPGRERDPRPHARLDV